MCNIKLIKGDCLEKMDKLIEKEIQIDLILTDIPYGTTACRWDEIIPFDEMWIRLNKLIKDNGAILLFGSEPFSSNLRMSNIKNYKYDWYWDKENSGGFATAKYKPLSVIEQILVFSKNNNKINYYPIMEDAEEKNKRPRNKIYKRKEDNSQGMASGEFKVSSKHNENKRYPKNILKYNNRVGELNALNRLHPTQKPSDMLAYLINTYTKENETILDFTMGSASTGIACINTNRNFIGIEKDDKYFDISCDRINNYIKDNNLENIEVEIIK